AAPNTADLPALPDSWCWASLDQVCAVFVDSAHRTPKYGTAGLPALGPRDVVNGCLDLNGARLVDDTEFAIQTARRIPQAGDVLYSRELSCGWAAEVPSGVRLCLSQGMCLFRMHEAIATDYVIAVINGPLGRAQAAKAAAGTAHPHVNLSDIKSYCIPLPP